MLHTTNQDYEKVLQQKAEQKRKFQESVNGFWQRYIIGLNKSMNEMIVKIILLGAIAWLSGFKSKNLLRLNALTIRN